VPAEPVVQKPAFRPTEVSLNDVYRIVMDDLHESDMLPLGVGIPNPDLLPIDRLNRMLASE